jgi:hypothetical protein
MGRLLKKTRGRQSRATVPLNNIFTTKNTYRKLYDGGGPLSLRPKIINYPILFSSLHCLSLNNNIL